MDLGTIANSTNVTSNTYVAKETKQAEEVKKYGVTGKTIGQPKLSENAKKAPHTMIVGEIVSVVYP